MEKPLKGNATLHVFLAFFYFMNISNYIGRFAPSPTGPLHFGSLVAAVASYCDAKKHGGKWLLRIEDLDKPREVKGAAQEIIESLAGFGFEWNDEIIYQSERIDLYEANLKKLQEKNLIYPCTCSRKEIADSSQSRGIDGVIYPKTCLKHPTKEATPFSLRIKTPNAVTTFQDDIQGKISQNLSENIGDFILKRTDNIISYQLAVVVDDAQQGVTHIVRGADLLDSTPRQIFLQQQLGYLQPHYAHLPIACNPQGEKLSKQTLAEKIEVNHASQQLFFALNFLNQNPPEALQFSSVQSIWEWAFEHWMLERIPNKRLMLS